MRILHICNDYCGSKVHSNLFQHLDDIGVEQLVYTYIHGSVNVGVNRFDGRNIHFIYSPILKLRHKFLYHLKQKVVYQDLHCQMQGQKIPDLVHASTLFSDGALAYRMYKEKKIPYIVAVRSTDIDVFLSLAPHTWPMGIRILKNAKKIIFISKAPMEHFCQHIVVKQILPEIQSKFVLLPNGIDDYWLNNISNEIPSNNGNIIYVGKFDKNKNIIRLINVVLNLRTQYPQICLHLVGDDGCNSEKVKRYVRKYPQNIIYHGKVYDKALLRDLYMKCSIFAMPSYRETFGLVYIEALTQHLAVIYTKRQGIDGLLDSRVGEGVNAHSNKSIESALIHIMENRNDYLACEVVDFKRFDWDKIAKEYSKIYKDCVI